MAHFTHIKRVETFSEDKLHFSHIHHYVSAYASSLSMVEQLRDAVIEAFHKAKRRKEPVIVNQDGQDFFLLVQPSGRITICLRWKSYDPIWLDEKEQS